VANPYVVSAVAMKAMYSLLAVVAFIFVAMIVPTELHPKAADQIKACGNRDKFLRRRLVHFARAVVHFLALAGGPELKVGPRPYFSSLWGDQPGGRLHEQTLTFGLGRWE
jgi:hypothetical protein